MVSDSPHIEPPPATDNPLLQAWDTPHGLPPFDRILPAHFSRALEVAMREHEAEIEAIATCTQAPSFANTIEALERSGRLLARVGAVLANLVSSLGGPALEAVDQQTAPLLARHAARIALDGRLFLRVDALHAQRDTLDLAPDQRRLLERRHRGFVRSGAALSPADKTRMEAIAERLATLHTQFGQNVVHDERAWHLVLPEDALAELPDYVRDGAREAGHARGLDVAVITLSRSLVEPFLMVSPRRDLRRVVYQAWVARGMRDGPHDNRPLVPEILALRRERAALLGYADYAAYRLDDTMAGSVDAVESLTTPVWQAGRARALQEQARLQTDADTDGLNEALQPWDWHYYSERVRRAEYALDGAELKPFFPLDAMQQAAFDTATRLFGLRFIECPDAPRYHPDTRIYEVQDADGLVGIFIADPHARPDKRSGAWMSSFRDQENLDAPVTPIIINNNNFARGTPTLLSFDDAETLFHEFGHALHGLLSRVRYPSQSGTSVRRDFVEFPSQIYEHWFSAPDTLRRYARHHVTNVPMPDTLIERLRAARNFNQGFATVEYTASALLDMALHTHPDPARIDVAKIEAAELDRIGMPTAIGPRHRVAHFQHLFAGGGYAAGYYSYLWAEVLDADGFEAFEAAGLYDPDLARRLRHVLQSGDSVDPMTLYTEFRGRAPTTKALLRSRGFV